MTQFLKKACISALVLGSTALSPAFAQTADPCVVATTIDSTSSKFNVVTTKRLVDYRTEQVIITMGAAASYSSGGNAASVQTKTFAELGATVEGRLQKARPAACPKQ